MPTNSVTIRDIAQQSGVSVGTVSRVLNQHPDVNQQLRQRVLDVATALHYSGVMRHGTQSMSRSLKQVGFLLAMTTAVESVTSVGPFWADVLHGVENQAQSSDCQITFRTVAPNENSESLARTIQESKLGGILLVGAASPQLITFLQLQSVPFVLVDHRLPSTNLSAVVADDFGGMSLTVRYLIDRGHRQIAFLGGTSLLNPSASEYFYTVDQRLAGYRHTLLSAGITVDPELHIPCSPNPYGGEVACETLLTRSNRPTAVCCANDKTAIGALKALHNAGIRVPEDISIIGYDDSEFSAHTIPALTTIHINAEAMGATALRVLLARTNEAESISATTTLDVTLTERASVRDISK